MFKGELVFIKIDLHFRRLHI